MNKNHCIDNCPRCGEVLGKFFFKKSFIPEDPARDGWSGVEGYFCAGCDELLIAVGFAPADRETFWIQRASSGEFIIPSAPPGRNHPCYIPTGLASAAVSFASEFSRLRKIRAEIGPRRKPDDPRLTLAISISQDDISPIHDTLNQRLTNTKSGRVVAQEYDSEGTLLHIELSEPVRATHMIDRLIRRFNLSGNAKLYGYNEGRSYALGQEP